ncbi:hypothetical protein EB796_022527 [Bugula neritina]|uniref:Uncharacterized protein n=1 Tax=Bugula neritina TaxID=10212 RepID=A0A7J7IZ42_BUGNE|nr:hypothetical protein EB796_022527 [Bugula neritina]
MKHLFAYGRYRNHINSKQGSSTTILVDTEKVPEYSQPPPAAPYQQPAPGYYQQPNIVAPMTMNQMQNNTTVIVNQAGPVSSLPYPQNIKEFSTGLCGCCSDIGVSRNLL